MRTQTFIVSMTSALVFAGAAQATVTPIVIDNFTNAGTIAGEGVAYNQQQGAYATGEFSSAGSTTGGNYLGTRQLDTWIHNTGDAPVSSTMSGNGQWHNSVSGGVGDAWNQLTAQYLLSSVQDLTDKVIYIKGSGTSSGGGIGVQLFTGADASGGFTDCTYFQIDVDGQTGNFTFTDADFRLLNSTFDFTNVNAIQVYMYAYGSYPSDETPETFVPNSWDYTATSFEIVPAPGAAALIGLAGLVATRRRRN